MGNDEKIQTTETNNTVQDPTPITEPVKEDDKTVLDPAKGTETEDKVKKDPEPIQEQTPIELKIPENSALSDEDVDSVKELAKELSLDTKQAQALLDREDQIQKKMEEISVQDLKDKSEEWLKSARQDREIGRANFDKSLESAHQALKEFGSPELNELLNQTQLGNHPEVIRAFSKIGAMISDDTFIKARNMSEGKKLTIQERWYPNMKKK